MNVIIKLNRNKTEKSKLWYHERPVVAGVLERWLFRKLPVSFRLADHTRGCDLWCSTLNDANHTLVDYPPWKSDRCVLIAAVGADLLVEAIVGYLLLQRDYVGEGDTEEMSEINVEFLYLRLTNWSGVAY